MIIRPITCAKGCANRVEALGVPLKTMELYVRNVIDFSTIKRVMTVINNNPLMAVGEPCAKQYENVQNVKNPWMLQN